MSHEDVKKIENKTENNPSFWFSYLVECADGSLYCGVTNNLTRRLKQHNGELVGGAKYTSARRPVCLKANWPHQDRAEASRHEYQVKQLTREQKWALIASSEITHFE